MNQTAMKDLSVTEKREAKQEEATREGIYFEPRVDIHETAGALNLVADVPGSTPDQLEIHLRESVLTLTARVNEPDKRWRPVYEEYRIGHYSRQFRIGHQIDQAKISAKMKDGVLTLALPKVENAQPRKIRVDLAE